MNEASSRNTSSSAPQCIISNGVQYTDPKSIATAQNCYFVSVGRTLTEKFNQSLNYGSFNFTKLPSVTFKLQGISESFVFKKHSALKRNKAIGLHKISARLLKCASRSLTPSVTKLLNLSIRTFEFLNIWKCSKVSALFKSGDRTSLSNYRPISILPTFSKISERAVHHQLYEHLIRHNLLSDRQFGFRPKHSTITAIFSFADEVLLNMERGKLCGAVFLDYHLVHALFTTKALSFPS